MYFGVSEPGRNSQVPLLYLLIYKGDVLEMVPTPKAGWSPIASLYSLFGDLFGDILVTTSGGTCQGAGGVDEVFCRCVVMMMIFVGYVVSSL